MGTNELFRRPKPERRFAQAALASLQFVSYPFGCRGFITNGKAKSRQKIGEKQIGVCPVDVLGQSLCF